MLQKINFVSYLLNDGSDALCNATNCNIYARQYLLLQDYSKRIKLQQRLTLERHVKSTMRDREIHILWAEIDMYVIT